MQNPRRDTPTPRCLRVAAGLLALASPLAAQDVIHVGPNGDEALLSDAISVAADGDILVLEDGYQVFEVISIVGKGLTLIADGAAMLTGFVFTGSQPTLTISGLSADQTVVIRGVDFRGLHEDPVTCARVLDCAGPVVFEDCGFSGSPGISLLIQDCTSVTAARCAIGPGGGLFATPGLRVDDSDLFLHDSQVIGGHGVDGFMQFFQPDVFPVEGGDGAWIFGGSRVFASGSEIRGGDGGSGGEICANGRDPGDGLRLDSGPGGAPILRTRDTTLATGTPGTGTCGEVDGQPGQDLVINAGQHVPLPGLARQQWLSAPTTIGDDVTLSFRGEPGDMTLLLLAPAVMPGIYFPVADLALHLTIPFADVPLGFLPASGELDLQVTVPSIPAGLSGVEFVTQALYSAGGESLMGGPSVGVFLAP